MLARQTSLLEPQSRPELTHPPYTPSHQNQVATTRQDLSLDLYSGLACTWSPTPQHYLHHVLVPFQTAAAPVVEAGASGAHPHLQLLDMGLEQLPLLRQHGPGGERGGGSTHHMVHTANVTGHGHRQPRV